MPETTYIDNELYTITEADLSDYSELLDQGVSSGQQVKYNSLQVLKYATGDKSSQHWEVWPRKIDEISGTRITFNE